MKNPFKTLAEVLLVVPLPQVGNLYILLAFFQYPGSSLASMYSYVLKTSFLSCLDDLYEIF